jgi:hypothetical protein
MLNFFKNETNTDSLWEAHSDSDDDVEDKNNFHKLTLEEVKKKIAADYEVSDIHRYSSALDNIASFIKSQAFLYNESANHCRFQLNLLMLPCIFLSSLCTVFSSISKNYIYGTFYIAIVNALIAFLLAIVNYLKLDAASESHHITSNNFLKLKIILEFSSGEVLLFQHPLMQLDGIEKKIEIWDKAYNTGVEERKHFIQSLYTERENISSKLVSCLQEKIVETKRKIVEIREINRFSIPKSIMNTYPIIFNINIFSFIKTIDDYRNNNILKLKNFRNELRYIKSKDISDNDLIRIKELYQEKMDTMNEIKILNSTSNLIDMMFQQEIKNSVLFKKYYYMFYIQKIVNIISSNHSSYFLPDDYKNPYDCGYYDKTLKKSLLRKILNQ